MDVKGKLFPLDFHLYHVTVNQLQLERVIPALLEGSANTRISRTRWFADHCNHRLRESGARPESLFAAGELSAIGLIDYIFHYISRNYVKEMAGRLWDDATRMAEKHPLFAVSGKGFLDFLSFFADKFPTLSSLHDKVAIISSHEKDAFIRYYFEEVFHLYLSNENPAYRRYMQLFTDSELRRSRNYLALIQILKETMTAYPGLGPNQNTLFDLFREPAIHAPDSVYDQLDYIYKYWRTILPDFLLQEILRSLDQIREESLDRGGWSGPVETFVPDYDDSLFSEYEAFSKDKEWMPNLVLIAKSTYVWLFQLSRKYQRPIQRLDDIPAEELDRLAAWGINGLWLIGVWERSTASKKIKQWMGNSEAKASAYSLYNYQIAADLGGDRALQILRIRLAKRGIRLAADMVPNHTGIFSQWMQEHPEWFLSLDASPYPGYRFGCENLADSQDLGIHIEDGYWNHSDAAVVFQYRNLKNGQLKYIYHGNDGTSTPWNDTAQLDYANPIVREAVIQEIIGVAKRFPIIRFDAAMTLTNRHIQRLWFPRPGNAGAIPSRAEFTLTQEEFRQKFPQEFWREVVDRIAVEAPDTLLLAEAFWLMEGYFVRTLGMHRVYNSAFMNMLQMEENSKYRMLVKETLEFNPEILKRYVNYMNNPDEESAAVQFGKGDKYFGVALLMVTMPGLPMWGHGQIEGYLEKYGMEYGRSYYDEQEDTAFIQRHQEFIFPLMRMRPLFSGVHNFAFFSFFEAHGSINENIFAYSNTYDNERGLILFNNSYSPVSGWIAKSVPKRMIHETRDELQEQGLAEALHLNVNFGIYYLFKDQATQLEYIRSAIDLSSHGLYVHLNGYQSQAFIHFREVFDQDGSWHRFMLQLNGQGVPEIEKAYQKMRLRPVLHPIYSLLSPDFVSKIRSFHDDLNLQIYHQLAPASADGDPESIVRFLLSGKITNAFRKRTIDYLLSLGIAAALDELQINLQSYPGRGFTVKRYEPQMMIERLANRLLAQSMTTILLQTCRQNPLFEPILTLYNTYFKPVRMELADNYLSSHNLPNFMMLFFQLTADFGAFVEPDHLSEKTFKEQLGLQKLSPIPAGADYALHGSIFWQEWFLGDIWQENLVYHLPGFARRFDWSSLFSHLVRIQNFPSLTAATREQVFSETVLSEKSSRLLLRVNSYQDSLWLHKESMEELFLFYHLVSIHYAFFRYLGKPDQEVVRSGQVAKSIFNITTFLQSWPVKARLSGYRFLEWIAVDSTKKKAKK